MHKIVLTIPGPVEGRPRPRTGMQRPCWLTEAGADYYAEVEAIVREHLAERFPFRVPVSMTIDFSIMVSEEGRRKKECLQRLPTSRRPSVFDVAYKLTDALSVLLYEDELQICNLAVRKRYGLSNEIKVILEQMEEPQ